MAEHQWMDRSQPQTLQAAVLFSYLNAALALLTFLAFGAGLSLVLVLLAGAAYGIANQWRWAYWAGTVLACLYLLSQLVALVLGSGFSGLLDLVFAGVLVALLLHPQSRAYERIWFH
ncbi:MAG: hypothetical protein M0Z95_25325 [Actinomycetota bacterium]|jgi:hypothetical protein|nr:hypothetical protein [Actinomycetota bacterium]